MSNPKKPNKPEVRPIIQSQEEADLAAEMIAQEFEQLRREAAFWKTVAMVTFLNKKIIAPEHQLVMTKKDQLMVQGMAFMIAKTEDGEGFMLYLDPGEELKGKIQPKAKPLIMTEEDIRREQMEAARGNPRPADTEKGRTDLVKRYNYLGEEIP